MHRTRSASLWRNSDLQKVIIGETVSDFGSNLGDLALPLLAASTLEASAGHALFGILGLPLALTVLVPGPAVPLVFASEFLQLAVNAIYMICRTSVEQALSPPALRGRIQASRTVTHAVAGVLGLIAGGLLGERANLSAAVVVGVVGGLTSFAWLVRTPLRNLRQLPVS